MQSLDLAEYNFLFALSFTTPTFDSEVAPSFGTLLATVNVALNMLGEVSWVLSDSGLSTPVFPPISRGITVASSTSACLSLVLFLSELAGPRREEHCGG